MDLNKISEDHIMYIVIAIIALAIAVFIRFICINSGYDTGTANLVFIIVLGIETVLYLILIKTIIKFIKLASRRKNNKNISAGENVSAEESVHDRIVKEKFEKSIADFCEYTQKAFGKYITAVELKKLCNYIDLFAREQSFENIDPVQTPSRQISNNDLYHYGWNLWNHFKKNHQDQRQDYVVNWLKAVFANLNEVEFSTIKGKLTIHDSKCKISLQKNIPDYLRFLKE